MTFPHIHKLNEAFRPTYSTGLLCTLSGSVWILQDKFLVSE